MRRPVALSALALASTPGCSFGSPEADALGDLGALDPPVTTAAEDDDGDDAPTTTSPSEGACSNGRLETASYRPDGLAIEDGSLMAEIRDRGELRVGVDDSTMGFAALDVDSGEIEGFEVELAHEIAERLFGDAYARDVVELVPVRPGAKTDAVRDGEVDITIDAITMRCDRWEEVAFSAAYYTATQEFLVRTDVGISDAAGLAERTVCVTDGSSSEQIMQAKLPDVDLLPVAARTDCLVALQEGDADAYFGHDTFLAGMILQDRNFTIVPGLLPRDVTETNYGIAVPRDHIEMVRFVNAALEDIRADGDWDQLHAQLREALPDLPAATAPTPRYDRG